MMNDNMSGGKLELGETPEVCVITEIEEELGLGATIGPLLDSWVYHIFEGRDVLILTYGCSPTPFSEITHSPEHKAVGLFRPEEVPALRMPEGYKQSIQRWLDTLKHSEIQLWMAGNNHLQCSRKDLCGVRRSHQRITSKISGKSRRIRGSFHPASDQRCSLEPRLSLYAQRVNKGKAIGLFPDTQHKHF
jgi:NUDIX domain